MGAPHGGSLTGPGLYKGRGGFGGGLVIEAAYISLIDTKLLPYYVPTQSWPLPQSGIAPQLSSARINQT